MYTLQGTDFVVKTNSDGSQATIPIRNGTSEDLAYQAWLADGNVPEPDPNA